MICGFPAQRLEEMKQKRSGNLEYGACGSSDKQSLKSSPKIFCEE